VSGAGRRTAVAWRGALPIDDLALVVWNVAAVPLLAMTDAAPLIELGGEPATLAGLLQLAAVLAAIAAVGTRPAGSRSPADRADLGLQVMLIGPFIGAVAFVGGSASAHLGIDLDGPMVGLAFLAVVAAAAFADRLPTLNAAVRRALLAPFVFICAGIFDRLAAALLRGLDVGELVSTLTVDQTGFGVFALSLLVAGLAAFYAALVVAPRAIVLGQSVAGWMAWPVRFLVFTASALFAIGWLTALTG